eukprot:TRINITY_DN2356_c0_g1_i2.p1 TRINITY_DN2356_c0_g1~~TRINITY_DN2356_c0_g1_i2.p1  ORF type:complete len:393 (-),score=39.35 TRINITY_DN2356_c0_g1_i2:183-1361(-)
MDIGLHPNINFTANMHNLRKRDRSHGTTPDSRNQSNDQSPSLSRRKRFCKESPSTHRIPHDRKGHIIFNRGDVLAERYKTISIIGEVLECYDTKTKSTVAMKIIRCIDKYRDAAKIEVSILETLNKQDPRNEQHCVQLLDWFEYGAHICLVFHKYGPSLYDLLKRNCFKPFLISQVRDFAYQIFKAVSYMHKISLIHTDLKPENILLVKPDIEKRRPDRLRPIYIPQSNDLLIIDFGSATFEHQHHTSIVSTRHYRPPEVILGLGWSYPCDMWSIGCILVELITGDALFQTHDNVEHLAMMEHILGPLPSSMIRNADSHSQKYFSHGDLRWPELAPDKESPYHIQQLPTLRDIVREHDPRFFELIRGLLRYAPEQRLTADQCLQHDFFSSNK